MRAHRRPAVWALPLLLGIACLPADPTRPPSPPAAADATVVVRAAVVGTSVALVVVVVTAPDITTPLVFNIPVTDGLALGSLTLPAGSNRTLTMRAYDGAGVETHRGAITLAVHESGNPTVRLTLTPLTGQVPVEIELGSVTVTVAPAADTLSVTDTTVLTARVLDELGDPVSGPVTWATSAPGVVAVVATSDSTARITALGGGEARVVATFAGTGAVAEVVVMRAGHYVAPSGSSGGDGSAGNPWDLQTALSGAGGRIQPGDTVWVRGGTYAGGFVTTLAGTVAAPIVVRAYPRERAILDGNGSSASTLTVHGEWAVYWGLEIMNSMPDRFGDMLGLRPTGVYVRSASNVKLINFIVHDAGHGTFTDWFARNIEFYGWIIFNGGHQNGTRSDGHGIYIKHDGPGEKVVRDNVIFNQFGHGIHGYTESDGGMRNLTIEGNVLFNNGELSSFDNPNLLLGGRMPADNDVVADNLTYFSPGHGNLNLRLGHPFSSVLNGSTVVRNNYVVGGGEIMEVGFWQNLEVQGNTWVGPADMIRLHDANTSGQHWSGNLHYRDPSLREWRYQIAEYNFAEWRLATGLAASDQAIVGTPAVTTVFVRPNAYEPGRATVVVYNWAGQGGVGVDLTGVVPLGHTYEIRNVQTIFDPPVAAGTFAGGVVTFPMSGVTAHAPIGGSPNPPPQTGPAFDVFIVSSRPRETP